MCSTTSWRETTAESLSFVWVTWSPIPFAAMADLHDSHHAGPVVDLVDNSIEAISCHAASDPERGARRRGLALPPAPRKRRGLRHLSARLARTASLTRSDTERSVSAAF